MTHNNNSSMFLRRVLMFDGVTSAATGMAMLLATPAAVAVTGASMELVRYAGLSLLPFAAFVLYLSQRDGLSRQAVWTVIGLNAAWVVGSILLLFTDLVAPTAFGTAFILLQAIAVAGLAEMQYVGLRKAWAAGA